MSSPTQKQVRPRRHGAARHADAAAAATAESLVWAPPDPGAAPVVQARLRELHHDLRQPLATVRALVFAAQSDPTASALVSTCLARIADETERMLELCRHVLEAGAECRLVDLAALAREVALGCQLATGRQVDVDADDAHAVVDPVDLRRALVNLVDNGARAAGPDGAVRVTVRRAGEVRVAVEDSGPGFAAGAPGTGSSLGLAIVSAAARRMGGRVEIGRSDLCGARVSLVLPAS
jgi:signal transduction histidine kinase